MIPPAIEAQLEAANVALNKLSWDDGVGLDVPASAYDAPAAKLAALYEQLLDDPNPVVRAFAVDGWADSRCAPLDARVAAARDAHLSLPDAPGWNGPVTWRNWKDFERATGEAGALRKVFDGFTARSAGLVPVLDERAERLRADFAAHGLNPAEIWAAREGTTATAVCALLAEVGHACRGPFEAALDEMSRAVFGRGAGPTELRALYLNRMYEPTNDLFASQAAGAVGAAQREFARMGFPLDQVAVDVEDRPRKYPGAFCFPVHIPEDVRVSVRVASPHHLVDMLYHEFGHAVHFAGIRADLSFMDRNWILSGTHETFSTLFEHLLGEPGFLRETFGFDNEAAARMAAFSRFKALLTAAWLGASALTGFEAWRDGLCWAEVEARYAEHALDFTGVAMPREFARLEGFAPSLSVYPAGYVLAYVRSAHWVRHLRALGGEAWWASPAAQADIRARIAAGARAHLPDEWLRPEVFLQDFVGLGQEKTLS
jgi:hypothetical protein